MARLAHGGLYARFVLPRLTDLAMRHPTASAERARFIPLASGVVLEVGIGSALNLPFYPPTIEKLYGVDPSVDLWMLGRRRVEVARFPVEFLVRSAESIPLGTATFDTVVSTWTLCTIHDPRRALTEMRRVLRSTGRLIFIEHGRAPDTGVRRWQDRLTPLWKRVAGGCHMNRKIDTLIADAGFHFTTLDTGYTRGPRPFVYLYRGVAHPAPG